VNRTPTALALTLGAALLLATPTQAQRLPVRGDWSIASQLFTSDFGTVFGVWRMMTDRINGGVEVDFRYGDSEEDVVSNVSIRGTVTTWELNIGPSVKFYGLRTGPVSPYLRFKASVGWASSKFQLVNSVQRDEDRFNLQGSAALGAEWYPIRQLAIGAHTGFQWLRTTLDRAENDGSIVRNRVTDTLGTFRSGLELHFFFR
jgi:hypothetical protein